MSTESFPRTLIVDLSKKYGGSASRVLSLLRNSPRGTIALAGLESSEVVRQASRLGVPIHRLAKGKEDIRILPRLIGLIRKERFEVMDAQNIQAKFWASMAARWTRCALVSTVHSWYAHEHAENPLKGRLYTALELATRSRSDLYISVSKKDWRMLVKAGVDKQMIHLVYNVVDIDPIAISGDRNWLRQKFSLAPDAIVATAVGRLVWMKGHSVLIEAMKNIAADVPQLVLLIVGEGHLKQELQDQIDQSGLSDRVHLIGYQNRESVLSIVKASDIYVMPSHYEGTPIALLEAAAMARPILSTMAGGIPEQVEDGKEAILVPPNDPDALGKGLLRLSKDKEYSRVLGLNAQNRVQQDFNLETQIRDTWSVYRKALRNHHADK